MWSDNETALDLVGFSVHADLVREIVMDDTLLPVTIGLFGDWGGGKSSIMRMIADGLDPEKYAEASDKARYENVACLYFNGWLFEGYDDAKAAIISTILKDLMAHRRFGAKVKDKAKELLESVDWMRAAKVGLTKVILPAAIAYATGGASLVPELAKAGMDLFKSETKDEGGAEKDDEGEDDDSLLKGLVKKTAKASDPKDVRTFRERFSELLKAGNITTLVVLIDDLDRCSPERIVENLEAIKLFLNVERTAFVIGADPRIVRHAIATHYAKNGGSFLSGNDVEEQSQLVKDYLEKVIQIPYYLPRLSPTETETYMSLLFCLREIKDDVQRGKVLAACEAQRDINRYGSFGFAHVKDCYGTDPLPDALEKSLSFTVGAAPLITEGLKGNPRQIKRFLNAFLLRRKLADVAKLQHVRDDVVVKLMILEYAHENEFKELYDWQANNDGQPSQLKAWEAGEKSTAAGIAGATTPLTLPKPDNWATPSLSRWLAMSPALADVDLRDYFWLARDKMASSLMGMSLVPPYLRRLLDSLLSGVSGQRVSAATEAAKIEENHKVALLDLLERRILSDAAEKEGYDALHDLIDVAFVGAADRLSRVLVQADAGKLPPGEAARLAMLLRSKPDLVPVFTPALKRHQNTNSPFGVALAKVTKASSQGDTR